MKRRVSEARPRRQRALAWLALATWLVSAGAAAKELDQFSDRLRVLHYYAGGYRDIPGAPGPERVDAILDARMNELLDALARALRDAPASTPAERDRLVRKVFQHRYLPELVTPYEEWIKHAAHVPLYKVRDKGIFGHAVDYDDMRLTWFIELSPIIQAGGVLMGIDKLGHFLAQGFQYYERYRELSASRPDAELWPMLREFGHAQEYGQLGVATGGVYSFADLAANWAGMSFFLALFDDIDIEGDRHARYFERARDGSYQRVRDFHWAEWVSPDWDEVLNPASAQKRPLYEKVHANLQRRPGPASARRPSICDEYRADPRAFLGPNRTLRARTRYARPDLAAAVAPYPLDVHSICSSE